MKKGFTLIELLVVISIVSLLASVVLYSTSEARLKAEDSRRVAQAVEVRKAIEVYKSENNNSYPVSANSSSAGLYREDSDGYNDIMSSLMAVAPRSSSGSAYYYEVLEDGSGQFLSTLVSDTFSSQEDGCVTSSSDSDCSYDSDTQTIQSCDQNDSCNDYDTSGGDSFVTVGGGGSTSLCGDSHNRAHDSYLYSESCSTEASYAGSFTRKYNGTQQWAEWLCRENSNPSNTENCQTTPESTIPPECGPAESVGSNTIIYGGGLNPTVSIGDEPQYCNTGVYSRPGIYRVGNTYYWECYTGASPDIPNGGSHVDCQYTNS